MVLILLTLYATFLRMEVIQSKRLVSLSEGLSRLSLVFITSLSSLLKCRFKKKVFKFQQNEAR